jgi:ParB/RepB/Spo0J family partition protein
MTTIIQTSSNAIVIPLERIHVDANVRDLDPEHVASLAGSIDLQGLLVPVIVAPRENPDGDYELVAGFHRHAACVKLGRDAIDAIVKDVTEDTDPSVVAAARATENIARKNLNAYEEAVAVDAMLTKGLTAAGAAQALGWPAQRVSDRIKLLELPEKAQRMIGAGELPLAAVDPLRGIGDVSRELLEALIDFVEGDERYLAELAHDIPRVIRHAVDFGDLKVFVADLVAIRDYGIEQLKLGKRATADYEELTQLHKKLNAYTWGKPEIRFADAEVDQARAAGVLIEGIGSPLIVDRSLYRELVKQAIKRTLEETRARAEQIAEDRKAEQQQLKAERAQDPEAGIKREHGREMRALAESAHPANTDLGWELRNNLSVVDPASIDVAKFFVYALLENGHSWSDDDSDKVTQLAMTGIRLVVDEFRQDVTKTRKDGSKGALRIDYGNPTDSKACREWLWKFIEGGKTAGDLYGRALVVIAAEHYASRLVVPVSQQRPALGWNSRDGRAIKALEKLAGKHVPVSLKKLNKAVEHAKAGYNTELAAAAARKQRVKDLGDEHVDNNVDDVDEFDADGDLDEETDSLTYVEVDGVVVAKTRHITLDEPEQVDSEDLEDGPELDGVTE